MTVHELRRRLRNYARSAEKTATGGRWEHRRQEAKGAARAYRLAEEWLAIVEEEKCESH